MVVLTRNRNGLLRLRAASLALSRQLHVTKRRYLQAEVFYFRQLKHSVFWKDSARN